MQLFLIFSAAAQSSQTDIMHIVDSVSPWVGVFISEYISNLNLYHAIGQFKSSLSRSTAYLATNYN